jgi:hypothetical protein
MMSKIPAALILLMALNGCQARTADAGRNRRNALRQMAVRLFYPHALPALVSRALIIDSEDVVYTFGTLDRVPGYPGTIGTWNNRVRMHAHFNKARHPPAMMLFCWDSVIDKKRTRRGLCFTAPSMTP